jgi:hypothetical protein
VSTDLNTLLTALYVWIDDYLGPQRRAGRPPKLSDAELLTLAVAQALLGLRSEARWLRLIPARLPGAFPYLPGQSGHNKRLRGALPLLRRVIRDLAADTDLWTDPVWLVDSTPVECARSRPAVQRSELAGAAGYGFCASHSRYFWGLRLHLICTPAGLPLPLGAGPPQARRTPGAHGHARPRRPSARRPARAAAHRRQGLRLRRTRRLPAHPRCRAAAPGLPQPRPCPGQQLLAPIRQLIESVNDTLKGQLDLELHGGRSLAGVAARVAQRLLALTAAIWHNRATGQPITRSLIAYDH